MVVRWMLILLALAPGTLWAQGRVHGVVRDSADGAPLALVEVVLGGSRVVARTDGQGRYGIDLDLGVHLVSFRRIGYRPVERQVRLTSVDLTRLDVMMRSEATQLAPVEVEAPAPPRSWPPGLDDRIKDGFGDFITDSMLRKFEHSSMSNLLLSRVSGVRFKRERGRNIAIAARGGRAGVGEFQKDCYFQIWRDGMLVWDPSEYMPDPNDPSGFRGNPPPDLDRWAVVGFEAIEVYTAAQVPAQYRGMSAGCGVILFWSRNQRR